MPLLKTQKTDLITKYGKHPTDTGSPEVQIALLTERITHINEHLRKAKKDHAGRRGLLLMVGQRNRLLKYMGRTDREGYQKLIATLGLRK